MMDVVLKCTECYPESHVELEIVTAQVRLIQKEQWHKPRGVGLAVCPVAQWLMTCGCLSQVLPAPEMVKQVEQEEEAASLVTKGRP